MGRLLNWHLNGNGTISRAAMLFCFPVEKHFRLLQPRPWGHGSYSTYKELCRVWLQKQTWKRLKVAERKVSHKVTYLRVRDSAHERKSGNRKEQKGAESTGKSAVVSVSV